MIGECDRPVTDLESALTEDSRHGVDDALGLLRIREVDERYDRLAGWLHDVSSLVTTALVC